MARTLCWVERIAVHGGLSCGSPEAPRFAERAALGTSAPSTARQHRPCPDAPRIPRQCHLYNWSIYSGWITPDVTIHVGIQPVAEPLELRAESEPMQP